MTPARRPWAWRWALTLLPPDFRRRHAEELEEVAQEHLAGTGRVGRARVWTMVVVDTLRVAWRLRHGREREGEGRTMRDKVWMDLSFAARALLRRPAFTLVAVTTLAVGIGANTAIFSVVDGVLLRPLPYPDSERIGILWHQLGHGAQNLPALHPLDLRDYRDRSELFDRFTMATGREWILGGQDDPELVDVGVVEAGFFEFFGATPILGRPITPEEDVPGVPPVAVLSHRLWTRRFGADPGVVGSSIELAGTRMEVIGVLPAWFRLELPPEAFLLRDAEVWVSLRLDPANQPPRNYTTFTGFGRLRRGATFAQGQTELEAIARQLAAEHPEHAASGLEVRLVPLLADVVKGARNGLLLLLGAVGFVLLIACANVANLLLVRGRARARELSIRAALGSGRAGLVRLTLVESLLLSVGGGALGLALAGASLELLTALGRASVPRLDAVRIDGGVLAFVGALCALSTVLFGLVPALRASSRDPADVLGADSRAGGGRRQGRFRDALVVFEVAASLVLLVGTGLMVRSFAALGSVHPGFATENRLSFRLALPFGAFRDTESRKVVERALVEEIGALPGVVRAAAISQLPLTGSGPLQPYAYDTETAAQWESVTADRRWITPGFFDAIGARLIEGRDLTSADVGEATLIVDDRLAERAFPGESAVGRQLQVNPSDAPEEIRYARIVGVVEHLRLHDLRAPYLTQMYWASTGLPQMSFVVHASGDAEKLAPAVRAVVERLAPGAPVEELRTLDQLARASLAPERLALVLMSVFGATALLLACVGIYGVLSNLVSLQTREIGVRLALGQSPRRALAQVVGRGMRLVVAAVAIGLAGALVLSRLLAAGLYGVAPWDPATYGVVCLVLVGISALACWIPARRATAIDPSEALRAE